jgi:phosphatidylinositol alpha-1,6-mannosyltransferase
MKVHLWVPELVEHEGGIQSYSCAILDALVDLLGEEQVSVLSRIDRRATLGRHPAYAAIAKASGDLPPRLQAGGFAVQAVRAALATRPRLIWTTHLNFAPVARWIGRMFQIPYVVTLHGIEAWGLVHPARVRALRSASLLLPVSRFTGDIVRSEQGIAAERFRVLPNCVDTERFRPGPKPRALLERYGITKGEPVALTVTRLGVDEPGKGLRVAFEAVRRARMRIPTLRYLLVGDGPEKDRVWAEARSAGIADCLVMAGRVPGQELADHYRLCDVFMMPAQREGFGIVFIEAMSCGRPVIAGNRDGSRDALDDGRLGILADPEDAEALSGHLAAVIEGRAEHPLLYHAEALHAEVERLFGAAALRSRLMEVLGPFMLKPRMDANERE